MNMPSNSTSAHGGATNLDDLRLMTPYELSMVMDVLISSFVTADHTYAIYYWDDDRNKALGHWAEARSEAILVEINLVAVVLLDMNLVDETDVGHRLEAFGKAFTYLRGDVFKGLHLSIVVEHKHPRAA